MATILQLILLAAVAAGLCLMAQSADVRELGRDAESPAMLNGDRVLYGVKMQYEPHLVPPGYAADAINIRFYKGIPETRKGVVNMPWLNKITAGVVGPWGTIYGQGAFRDPNAQMEVSLIAADGGVWASVPNVSAQPITLPPGVVINAPCRFYQCFNVVVLARGTGLTPLVMTSLAAGFTEIQPAGAGTGTRVIPNFLRGLPASNRLFCIDGDNVLASDLLDYTHFSLLKELRINAGSEDQLVQIGLFGRATMIALKALSVYRIDNLYGDLSATTLSRVTQRYGCVAPLTAIDTGKDFIWLSQEGIASLRLTEQNEVQSAQGLVQGGPGGPGAEWPMFSDDIKPLIDRIAWRYASNACAAMLDGRIYFAVPLDDGEALRDELLTGGRFNALDTWTFNNLVIGKTYRFTKSLAEFNLVSGSTTLTQSGDFVADNATVTITRQTGYLIALGSLRQVLKGVNNAILVYDTKSGPGAWAGHDEAPGIEVAEFAIRSYQGKRRLFLVGADGYMRLYEEDFEDQLAAPYTDLVTVQATSHWTANFGANELSPPAGDTIQVNGGTIVTTADGANNGAATWGEGFPPASNAVAAGNNLLGDLNVVGGFFSGATTPWTTPNAYAIPLPGFPAGGLPQGIRIIATNQLPPAVLIGALPASSITRIGQVAQYNCPNDHGLVNGQYVTIAGATQPEYNGTFKITLVDPLRFNYTVTGTPATPATGSPVIRTPSWAKFSQNATRPIIATLLWRGYTDPAGDLQRTRWLRLDLQGWNAQWTIDLLTEGAQEVTNVVTNMTRDRTVYYRPFNKPRFDTSNVNGDFLSPDRQDYSVVPDFPGWQVFPGAGLRGDIHQEAPESYRVAARGRVIQPRIVNTRGRVRMVGMRLESADVPQRAGAQR